MSQSVLTQALRPYDRSLFGGLRAHPDLAVIERLHDYPGPATAYEPDYYGFQQVNGTCTHDTNVNALKLTVAAGTSGDKARLRTHDVVRYQPGCMPVVQMTGWMSLAMTSLKCVRRSSATGSVVDTTEATLSTTDFDSTKAHRFELRYAYLGVQTAQWWINGSLVKQRDYAGTLTVPYMRTPHLPLSVEIVNVNTNIRAVRFGVFDDSDGLFFEWTVNSASSLDVYYKCASARLAGGAQYPYWSYATSLSKTGVGATQIPSFSIRPKSTINGVTSRAQVFPTLLSFFAETQPGNVALILNPATLPSATWLATSPSTGVEIDIAAGSFTGGQVIWQAALGQNSAANYDLRQLFTLIGRKLRLQAFTGTPDVLTVAVQREGAVNFDPRVTLAWDELR